MTNDLYTVSEIRPRVFLLKFQHRYDLCMYFLRYQEFYESPAEHINGKSFDILDFMRWYSFNYGDGCFTYTKDWSGFNLVGDIVKQVIDLGIEDLNKYDVEMQLLYRQFVRQYRDGRFSIIGTFESEYSQTVRHEVAHAFFYLNDEYHDEMTDLVNGLDRKVFRSVCKSLTKMGYNANVHVDECQAYFSTGLCKDFSKDVHEFSKNGGRKKFVKVFNKWFKETK